MEVRRTASKFIEELEHLVHGYCPELRRLKPVSDVWSKRYLIHFGKQPLFGSPKVAFYICRRFFAENLRKIQIAQVTGTLREHEADIVLFWSGSWDKDLAIWVADSRYEEAAKLIATGYEKLSGGEALVLL